MAVKIGDNKGAAKQLKGRERLLLRVLSWVVAVWSRSLRFRWEQDVQDLIDSEFPPTVVIAWHNRLFLVPYFYKRYFGDRRLATLISASGDGAWLAALMELVGIRPVRGSRYNRGAQALKELLQVSAEGFDVGVTPDGSRGPMYDMKPGALSVALKREAPVILLSFNFSRAWRLKKSWDQFYLPVPFSKVEVCMEVVPYEAFAEMDAPAAAAFFKERLMGLTVDL